MKKYHIISAIIVSLMIVTYGNASGQTSNSSGVQAVDLGLSVKWADRNVGASTPSDFGDYYAWGEISVKDNYSWEKYKWCNGSAHSLTKYNTYDKYGTVDNRTRLYDEDDVAHVKLGGNWRMPTKDEFRELLATKGNENYKWEWTSIKGHTGWKITYRVNNQTIFIPAADGRDGTSLPKGGSYGYYWSSSLNTAYLRCAWSLCSDSKGVGMFYYDRNIGSSVRPVTE